MRSLFTYIKRQSLLLFVLFFSSWFAPLIARAQIGEITGRVVTEDGAGLPNVKLHLFGVDEYGRPTPGGSAALSSEDGSFKLNIYERGLFSMNVSVAKEYVPKSISVNGKPDSDYYRIGDNITITMIKGGAITGRITNAMGEPVIGARVGAAMAQDGKWRLIHRESGYDLGVTDDRGVYRIYGLAPGTYVVFTRSNIAGPYARHDADVPTYHPSSSRDTAAEVTVVSGGETGGIDIRHNRGRVISGEVSGGEDVVYLHTSASTGALTPRREFKYVRRFEFRGLPDGEYFVVAGTSAPRRILLKGSDVTGIELKLLPLSSISGRIVIESSPDADGGKPKIWLQRFSVTAIRDNPPEDYLASLRGSSFNSRCASAEGAFTISNVDPGHYRIEARLPDEDLYVKAITAPTNILAWRGAPPSPDSSVSRDGLALKPGENLGGMIVTVAEGAASVRGKIVAEKKSARAMVRLRAHLIPAEPNAADDLLRYSESLVQTDGSFSLNNVAPGKYWLIARAAPDDEPGDRPSTPIAWDANERAKLRREAAAAKNEIELKPCQRVKDHVIRW